MDIFSAIGIAVIGGGGFLIYRSHKQNIDRQSVCEVVEVLRGFSYRFQPDENRKVNKYEIMADGLMEALAAVSAKRQFDSTYADHIWRQIMGSSAPDFLESIGIFRGTARFNRSYSALFALASDFERINPRNR